VNVFSAGQGEGSTFEVRIPLTDAPADSRQLLSVPALDRAARHRCVLIVEDSEDIRESSRDLLAIAGFEAVGVATGAHALERAPQLNPDVVLLDVGLPDMPQFSTTVLIAITGYDTPEARRLSAAAGFNHHICKPVDFDNLLALLDGIQQERAF
jgi:DNA-binding response OmpR family regulator